MRRVLIAALVAACVCSSAIAQEAPDAEALRRAAREYAEAHAAWEQRGIDTALADAVSDLGILDGYNPAATMPLGEMPRLPGRGYLLVRPGCYALHAASFCLCAGAYAPGGGDGYALAPLEGMGAALAKAILERWADHPEIDQQHIQALLWAVDGRLAPDRLSPELQAAAGALLTAEELAGWRGLARGEPPEPPDLIPDEELAQADEELQRELQAGLSPELLQRMESLQRALLEAAGDPERMEALSAELEQVMLQLQGGLMRIGQAQAAFDERFGPLFEAQRLAYEEAAALLAPEGDPEPPAGSREIPLGRWSYHPGGYFIRFLPITSFSQCLVQVSLPAAHVLERDPEGRIVSVAAPDGNRVVLDYAGAPAAVVGEAGVHACRLRAVTYRPADGKSSAWEGAAIATVGVPGLESGAEVEAAAVPLSSLRTLRGDLVRISGSIRGEALPSDSAGPALVDALDLASLAGALGGVTGYVPPADPATPPVATTGTPAALEALTLVQEALQWAIRAEIESQSGPATGGRPLVGPGGAGPFVPVVLARARSAGGSVNAPGCVAQPGNTARQRLGFAPRPSESALDKEALRKAMEGCEMVKDLLDLANGVTDPVGWLMEKMGLGMGIPGMLFDQILSSLLEAAMQISQALTGDPPRADFARTDLPARPELPRLEAPRGSPPEVARAGQEVLDGLAAWYADARSAQVCLDRMGGAHAAGAEEWVWVQAEGLVYYKRQCGLDMLRLADALERLMSLAGEQDAGPRAPSSDRIEQRRARLRGALTETEREALGVLGLGEAEFLALRETPAAVAAEDLAGARYVDLLEGLVEGLRAGGAVWSRLPEVEPPTGPGVPVAQAPPRSAGTA